MYFSDIAAVLGALVLLITTLLHSFLGERLILQPLFAATWEVRGLPRNVLCQILHFAWHLTSIAWASLALLLLQVSLPWVLFGFAFSSALLIFAVMRAHFAWAAFLFVALAVLFSSQLLPVSLWVALSSVAGIVASGLGAIHFYWAFGGKRGQQKAIPRRENGTLVFQPTKWMTVAVGVALFTLAWLCLFTSRNMGPSYFQWALLAAAFAFALRVLGDGTYVGFSKKIHRSVFARLDDQVYTPLSVLLMLGSLSGFVAASTF